MTDPPGYLADESFFPQTHASTVGPSKGGGMGEGTDTCIAQRPRGTVVFPKRAGARR